MKKFLLKIAGLIVDKYVDPQNICVIDAKLPIIRYNGEFFEIKEVIKKNGINMPSELVLRCQEIEIEIPSYIGES